MQTITRKSVPLEESELDVVAAVRSGDSPERAALEALVGRLPQNVSESQVLADLVALGAARVREQAVHAGYAAYAAALDDEDRQFAAAQRTRRARLTD
ncbi:hypothetical protein [Oerskovia flava]|uniref:hypothetical protein n=1 Tax=Oerskovia flava TaxID=2986422 RepID=UPI00223F2592|nr:hypothetical protein [Oerskovia sp. JB1-3-2]